MRRLLENSAAALLILAVLIFWQIAVPLSGLSEFILPTPFQIGVRLVEERWLLLENSGVTTFEEVARATVDAD